MANFTLNDEEADVLRSVLSVLAIKRRTREIGIAHGMDRFVSTNKVLNKHSNEVLDGIAKKLGLVNGVATYDKD